MAADFGDFAVGVAVAAEVAEFADQQLECFSKRPFGMLDRSAASETKILSKRHEKCDYTATSSHFH